MDEMILWRRLTPQERDALVAEKVFHRKIYKPDTWGRWLLYHETETGITEAIPRYSEIMDAAVEVMRHFTVPVTLTYSGATFMCKIVPVLAEDEPVYGLSDNPAKAICIAALRAVGQEVSLG